MVFKDGIFKEMRRKRGAIALAAALAFTGAGGTAAAPAPRASAAKITTPAERCSALEKQFDIALQKGGSEKAKAAAAQKLRAEGGHLCETGKHAAGALRLAKALADIGVDPDVH